MNCLKYIFQIQNAGLLFLEPSAFQPGSLTIKTSDCRLWGKFFLPLPSFRVLLLFLLSLPLSMCVCDLKNIYLVCLVVFEAWWHHKCLLLCQLSYFFISSFPSHCLFSVTSTYVNVIKDLCS